MTPSNNTTIINSPPPAPTATPINELVQNEAVHNLPPTQPSPTNSAQIHVAASQDSKHSQFHINFGKVLATALLGLQLYGASKEDSTFFKDPQNDAALIQGFTSIWVHPS